MSEIQIRFHEDRIDYSPEEVIDVGVQWKLSTPPEYLELRLLWYTEGKGTSDMVVVDTIRIDNPQAEDIQIHPVRLPASPFSFSGTLISLVWALDLTAFPSEDTTQVEIIVAPNGEEVEI